MKAWAAVGSHGKIFGFIGGPVAERYPSLLEIYGEKIIPSLVEVEIKIKRKQKKVKP